MQVINSTIEDIDTIFKFYDIAIAYQKTKFNKHWQGFDRELVETEIAEKRQYKILVDGKVACVFAVTFNDAAIWGERDKAPAIYLHRIVTDNTFRGNNFVTAIMKWAVDYFPLPLSHRFTCNSFLPHITYLLYRIGAGCCCWPGFVRSSALIFN